MGGTLAPVDHRAPAAMLDFVTPNSRNRTLAPFGALVLGALLLLVGPPRPASGASGNLYVDGKIGYDSPVGPTSSLTWGRSTAQPFKTVERALEELRFGLPPAIRIKGYNDYVYYETITHAYHMFASATAPLTIGAYTTAEDPAAAGIRPIIDGGLDVGKSGWHRPNAASYPHVWCKTWNPPGPNLLSGEAVPPGYDSDKTTTRQDRFYFDTSEPLHRPVVAPTMAQLNAQPFSQFWDDSKATDNLCVHLGRWDGAAVDENPANHRVLLPWYRGIIVAGGSSYVTVRDLRIRHTIMGVGFSVSTERTVGKAHHNKAYKVDSSYNYQMGFWTAGDYNGFDHVSGSRNSIQLIKLDQGKYSDGTRYGAQHNTVRYARGIQNITHGVKLFGAGVQRNTIVSSYFDFKGIPAAAESGGQTQGVQISNAASYNDIRSNRIVGADAAVELYQYDLNGGPLVGNTVRQNRFEHVGFGVFLWDTKAGGSSFGTGSTTFDHNVYYDTQVAIGGNGTTSGKVFDHETIYHAGFRNNPTAASVDSPGVTLMTGSITIKNSVIDDTNGPSICAHKGAKVYLSYTDTYAWRNDPRSNFPHGTYCYSTAKYAYGSVVVGSGVVHVAPGYDTDPSSSSFLVISSPSPLSGAGTGGSKMGAL